LKKPSGQLSEGWASSPAAKCRQGRPGGGGLYLALLHHPVVDKKGVVIASSVTNLDLHDIARVAKTYGVRAFFVVTPLDDQQALVRRILDHWLEGFGALYNPRRGEALTLVRLQRSLAETCETIRNMGAGPPVVVATSARGRGATVSYARLRRQMRNGRPHLIVFGTAWGLAPEVLAAADCMVEPVCGTSDYNHLSVRSAVAIILDRLQSPPTDRNL
jgi:hypothetical protein